MRRPLALLFAGWCSASMVAHALPIGFKESYGFGTFNQKRVTLVRKLAPDLPLSDVTIRVKVEGRADPARLQNLLETLLVQNGPHISVNEKQPLVEIRCVENSWSQPREDFTAQNNVTSVHFSGSIAATFQVVVASTGQSLLAGTETNDIAAIYPAANDHHSYTESDQNLGSVFSNFGKSTAATAMPSEEQLVQEVMSGEASRIASHLVTMQEQVAVMLAKGPALDDANRRAMAGQWTEALSSLDGTKPLDRPEDEAYRLYDLGVANEALGYKADDLKSAATYLEMASKDYSKALEDNPKEKNFLEPQNRIQAAMIRIKQLTDQNEARQKRIQMALEQAKAEQAKAAADPTGGAAAPGAPAGRATAVAAASAGAGEVLSNADVLKMVKAKFPERMILSKIQSAPRVNFDTTVDGMIRLKDGGASEAEIQLMDQRMQQARTTVRGR